MHSGDDLGGIAHPVQRGVAEYRVEFVIEIESLTVHYAGVQAEFSRGIDLLSARIDTDDLASQRDELRSESAVAAAEVQDALTSARRKQIDHWRAEVSDEAGIAGVAVRIPSLLVCHFRSGSPCRNSLPAFPPFAENQRPSRNFSEFAIRGRRREINTNFVGKNLRVLRRRFPAAPVWYNS